ncbi:hypothetical protein H2198_005470 [Neophaeococcomyces mojaviensis]|uniref:Uncharacterized protein n=1 Tax=Neophaeococcomyces mojaviensis TaxID=3383035 RepID=A0ACC3A5W1_9EURO|nr:hypothetical protein H2198_005470 [Knufia sp. JES_112]
MALPIVKIASDCADYANTLRPYLYQLRPLPALVSEHLTDSTALKQLYVDTNPFVSGLAFSLFLSPFFLLASEVNQNWSQIDRVWSIIPTLYNAHWAIWSHMAGIHTERMDLRLLVSVVWSMRLTYNYWRRGGYKIGSEDYRWAIIKDRIGQPAFFILDVLFIASGQNILLFLVTCPSYIAVLVSRLDTAHNTPAAGFLDYWFAGQILFLVGLTWLSDQQQWDYQSAKQTYRNTAKVPANCGFTAEQLDRGFRTTGLWAYSRHPNFACEQMVWWSFYLWASLAARSPFNWTIFGPIIYTSVFLGSTPITEYISSGKYHEYAEYQKQVGMLFPKSFSEPKFSGKSSPQKKRIADGGADASAKERNAADYEQAKRRYDLR